MVSDQNMPLLSCFLLIVVLNSFSEAHAESYSECYKAFELETYDDAFRLCGQYAAQGDMKSNFMMGRLHEKELSRYGKIDKALSYYEKASDLGSVRAVARIAVLYDYGIGVSKDRAKAFRYYSKAATNNDLASIARLGDYYRDGLATKKNIETAIDLYKQAIPRGSVDALKGLALIYNFGNGVPVDLEKAESLYLKALALGDKSTFFDLGALYRDDFKVLDKWVFIHIRI